MSILYELMYRIGFTPWDNEEVPAELIALVDGPGALVAGRALDIGCGTGTQAVYLAKTGWRVTGVDVVKRPLGTAKRRAAAAGVSVNWVQADVTRLEEADVEPGLTLLHDRGCYHGLPARARAGYARSVTALANPGATLLVMSFAKNRKLGGLSGTDEQDICAQFDPEWELKSAQPDTGSAPPGPMRDVERFWYRFIRRELPS